ncbi:flagellar hook-associated protein FlgK [Oryzifoliimicrobium ureilyticus]|uniref:flagellar hook-associated protein FlgK n=1 Tax=Oryzifoliimicrobium ureilyticus TaxID=3113724 RepID=UPI003075FA31
MSLTSALNTAQNIFNNTGTQSSVVSNNISNNGNKDYVRRDAAITTSANGAQVVQITRAQDDALLKQYLSSSSQDSAQQALLKKLTDLKSIFGGNDNESSPSTYLSAFQSKLQAFRTSPSSTIAAQSVVNAAQDLTNSLNNASSAIQSIRAQSDGEISTQVNTLNTLLSQFQTANDAVKSATATNTDPNDALDQREKVLKQISSIIGVNVVDRKNGDMALYTSDGTTLFETLPRTVSFSPKDTYVAASPDGTPFQGNAVYIDGVPLAKGQGATTTGQGSLQALLQVRDEIAPTLQSQLDETAKGMVSLFSENGASGKVPGLFTWAQMDGTAGDTPTTSDVLNGISGTITVNPAVITSAGGDPMKLRDGSISGLSQNSTNSSGFSDLLDSYLTALNQPMNFDPSSSTAVGFNSSTGISSNVSIMSYASNSLGWLEQYRSDATTASESTSASLSRSDDAYSNTTGVNLDEELTLLLDIEQSYKAATKILNTVDEMMKSLLDIAS